MANGAHRSQEACQLRAYSSLDATAQFLGCNLSRLLYDLYLIHALYLFDVLL